MLTHPLLHPSFRRCRFLDCRTVEKPEHHGARCPSTTDQIFLHMYTYYTLLQAANSEPATRASTFSHSNIKCNSRRTWPKGCPLHPPPCQTRHPSIIQRYHPPRSSTSAEGQNSLCTGGKPPSLPPRPQEATNRASRLLFFSQWRCTGAFAQCSPEEHTNAHAIRLGPRSIITKCSKTGEKRLTNDHLRSL